MPCSPAKSAAAGSGSMALTTRSLALVLSSGTMMRPHQPRPQTATPSFSISVDRGAGLLRHLRPAARLGGDELGERGRRCARHDICAAVGEALDDLAR